MEHIIVNILIGVFIGIPLVLCYIGLCIAGYRLIKDYFQGKV
jgi:hypothetical protein